MTESSALGSTAKTVRDTADVKKMMCNFARIKCQKGMVFL